VIRLTAVSVSLWLAISLSAQPSVLQIRVLEGEGAVYAPGSRATRGLTVLVTDTNGNPVEAATVSFQLPSEGPGGTFANGARSEIVPTSPDGRATVWGMRWNRVSGQFQMRVTASKGAARAGTFVSLTLSDRVAAQPAAQRLRSASGRKWVILSLAAAGGAVAAGFAAREAGAASDAAAIPLRIGQPSINLGRP
jgi:hypothetical protein